ncbi:MAG TPA: amino acid adenylation domain-containing protein [Verrucomicrobiae bacterium]|jgi:amino acid adenylation domain-containing protein|nr:amino acid adenylation domain-containing protein [Verrucomicrobiae bacterium]
MSTDATTASAQPAGLSTAKQALLSKWLRGGGASAGSAAEKPIPRRQGPGPVLLSVEQQRIWFFNQLEPDSPLYNMPIASRVRGPLDPQALQQAMDLVVARHEALRTRFTIQESVQTIDAPSPVPMLAIDLREFPFAQREAEAKRLLEAEAKRPFDLSRDLMVRTALVRLDEQDWIFFVLMHHIASDDWSWRVFCNEVAAAYGALIANRKPELPEPPIQYGDFAVWQKDALRSEALEKQLVYWRKQLQGAPAVLELPADHPRPASQTFRGACEWLRLPPDVTQKLNVLGQSGGFTPFMILLAGFQTLIHRYTGLEDIVVGSPVAGRTRGCLEKVIGLFVNMLALRTKLDGNPGFFELLHRTQTTVLEALAHQELPFEKLVEELQPQRSASYSPLIQVMFALQDELSDNLKLPGLATAGFPVDPGTAKFDLTFTIVKSGSHLDCCAEFNADLFEAATVRRMLAHYRKLLESIAANPDQCLSDIPLLTDAEQKQILVDWNQTSADFPRAQCVHDLFATQAAATPKSVAVVFGTESFTYEELNWRANQLAQHLKFLGIGAESLVAVSMERSLEMVVALLGILKAGAAYVPLDPSFPADRLRFMLEDSKAALLLTRSGEKERLGELAKNIRALCLDTDWRLICEERDENPRVEMTPENLAYVIYTSGSTGWPKGVQIPHRAVVNFLHSMRREPGLTAADTLLSVTSISFDIAALEIFLPLTVGARLVLAGSDDVYDAARMKALIRASRASVMQATPSFWQFLIESDWFGDRRMKILCGGEALSRELADKLLERAGEVWNLYGPTETTIWSTLGKITPGTEPISIGRPIANTQIYLLDSHLQPVPVGIPGELHIGGDGLARGYLNRPQLTEEKFIPNPFPVPSDEECNHPVAGSFSQAGTTSPSPILSRRSIAKADGWVRAGAGGEGSPRLYKTGDIARYRPDGAIECLGRNDFQVKLRGHRIDLGEIESALRQFPNVRDAVVVLREDERHQKCLAAYLLRSAHPSPDAGMLQAFLRKKLPDYMMPAAFVVLEKFPLTPNGKINRQAMPAPASNCERPKQSFTPPRTPAEETLAKIWRDLLHQPEIGIDDNFFESGGHSLLAMQLMARVRKEFSAELSLRNIFEAPTIAELANILARKPEEPAREIAPPLPRPRLSPEQALELLDKLDELSDSEVDSLLQQVSVESGDKL